ncbi:hypothetical protein HMPREF9955_1031 [Staphylococcus epidermidis FS1]|nr:hypothetical protein HMPREF9955_1031 [Staphylococcus epidermidis FS1]
MRQENDVFHHLLQHFDSTAFMDFSTYRDDRPLKNAIKRLKEQYKSKCDLQNCKSLAFIILSSF